MWAELMRKTTSRMMMMMMVTTSRMMMMMMMMMKLNPKLVKPKRVDEKDDVKDKVAKDGHYHQWFPAYKGWL